MKATTIKLDGQLLSDIEAAKPPESSVTAFIKRIVQDALQRDKLTQAAKAYESFMGEHPEEASWLADWERADLAIHIDDNTLPSDTTTS